MLEFKHTEKNDVGEIKVFLNYEECTTERLTMSMLTQDPLKYKIFLGNQINEIKYYTGPDNPGCFLYVNNKPFEEMPAGPEKEELPEFQRGIIRSNDKFSGPYKETHFEIYVGDELEYVPVSVVHKKKSAILSIKSGKQHKLLRGITLKKLEEEAIICMIIA